MYSNTSMNFCLTAPASNHTNPILEIKKQPFTENTGLLKLTHLNQSTQEHYAKQHECFRFCTNRNFAATSAKSESSCADNINRSEHKEPLNK